MVLVGERVISRASEVLRVELAGGRVLQVDLDFPRGVLRFVVDVDPSCSRAVLRRVFGFIQAATREDEVMVLANDDVNSLAGVEVRFP